MKLFYNKSWWFSEKRSWWFEKSLWCLFLKLNLTSYNIFIQCFIQWIERPLRANREEFFEIIGTKWEGLQAFESVPVISKKGGAWYYCYHIIIHILKKHKKRRATIVVYCPGLRDDVNIFSSQNFTRMKSRFFLLKRGSSNHFTHTFIM